MNPITEIKNRLDTKHPDLEYEVEENTICVKPKNGNGFEVWFSDDGHEYTVGYEGWHQHFQTSELEEALDCFAFGFSDECRLKVVQRGSKTYKWQMQSLNNGKWVTFSTTGLIFSPFWRKAKISYLSNNLISAKNA